MYTYHLFEIKVFRRSTGKETVKITSLDWNQSILIPYDYSKKYALDIAAEYLAKFGYEFIGVSESAKAKFLISTTFRPLK